MNSLLRLLMPFALSAAAPGCDGDQGPCAGEQGYAVQANISDSAAGRPLAYRSSLIIREGTYVDSVSGTSGDSATTAFLLAGRDREGTYDVTVRREGSRLWTRGNVRANRDRCGDLQGSELNVRLQPVG